MYITPLIVPCKSKFKNPSSKAQSSFPFKVLYGINPFETSHNSLICLSGEYKFMFIWLKAIHRPVVKC